nr:PREDICTED: poly(A)-specific ribonuclease PARN-like domain-containing protein 1 [Latimeria chalumnae]|eukprot:XP_005999336.2 PREDICTED: poly(A)-specific ribonuclease PARN-like domain-containing protein 1 [Latimeria chalumnae]
MQVVASNFLSLLPQIREQILGADFVAIDTELTGLHSHTLPDSKPSLFDSAETRYQKLRLSVQKFTVSQIGLSIFSQEGDRSNGFTARSYNFSLFPPNFGKQDTEFSVQSSSAIFLARFGFDFNQLRRLHAQVVLLRSASLLESWLAGGRDAAEH